MTVVNLFSQQNPPLIFGHRGCRGILPENTLESFKKALTYDIDGIEWDVVVNKDKQLVISHEEYMDKTYCLAPDGSEIKHNKDHCLYEMTQKEIEAFDCGTKPHPKFPEQQHIKSYKPLVQEAFNKIDFKDKTILFEIKSEKKLYGKAQPYPEEYVEIILNEVAEFKGREQIIFMSFDPQIIELLHQKAPDYKLVYLHESLGLSGNKILKQLSFKPYALGIYSKFISPKMVKNTHEQGVKVFAWTVNKEKEFNRLLETNLDGIITDFPNLYGR
ncbi:MAG: glycerophosphodiester phosphodiesterase family protein [Flavobacteriales bacterium]|jgi:glycerophosphoryl diester phosphodiesterase|nr:glycerophosphodiester phosphodiesterase family protein [Flavobacteriales bacterium]